jgi:transcriptional regulator with XRE-family HTH domain
MEAADIVRIARRRAGLSQEQLGLRSGMHRNVISRWERGESDPSLASLRALVAACDLELVLRLSERDESLTELVEDQLALTPLERLDLLLPGEKQEQVRRSLRWLADVKTPVVLIGQIAAALQGAPQRVNHAQVEVVSRDVTSTEAELQAAGYEPVDSEARWRASDQRHSWQRFDASVEVAIDVSGTTGFADLNRSARVLEIDDATFVAMAHPRDLVRLADASPTESERARVPGLQALLAQHSSADR